MNTYRAAYIPSDSNSTSGGIRLTCETDSDLSDEELMILARHEADWIGIKGNIVIGEWVE
jgi:hypothetical protein